MKLINYSNQLNEFIDQDSFAKFLAILCYAGEGTQTTIINSKFQKCNIGVAVKDRSRVNLKNNLFSKNNVAYNTYRKKWRWAKGGEGFLKENIFLGSVEADIKGDKHSKVIFIGKNSDRIKTQGQFQLISNYKK